MTDFQFTERVSDPHADIITAALYSGAGTFNNNDLRKAVKLSTTQGSSYELCAAGDEIEGVVWASDPNTVNSGSRLGSVLRGGQPILAQIASDQPVDGGSAVIPAVVGDLVVAGAGATLNTDQATLVKTGTPSNFKWRITRIVSGGGAVGSTVLIERI